MPSQSMTLGGHRDFADTACPGANLYSHLTSGDLHTRTDALLAAPVRRRGRYLFLLGSLQPVVPVISAAAWDPKRSVVPVSLVNCRS